MGVGAVGQGPRPPDGLIVFSCSSCADGQGSGGLYTIRPDGRALRKLQHVVGDEPAWSPDGRMLAVTRDDGIWLSEVDGSNARRVTRRHPRGYDGSAAWSPDGTKLVFERGTPRTTAGGYRWGLWTVAVRGGRPRPILVAPEGDEKPEWTISHPDWSPDGSRIAFGFGRERLKTIRPDGTGVRRLGPPTLHGRDPHWSPDGRRIAFLEFSDYDRPHRFRILDVASGRVRTVFATAGDVWVQSWSPDSRWLAIAATRRVECEFVILDDECESLDLWIVDATNARRNRIHSFGQEGGDVTGIDWKAAR
ncbi:MAG TPA: hypothetical protein VFU99_01260 [Gaiellaceae bacterium]|nr:hypothetical protein [Gaiellaceae bacterium]